MGLIFDIELSGRFSRSARTRASANRISSQQGSDWEFLTGVAVTLGSVHNRGTLSRAWITRRTKPIARQPARSRFGMLLFAMFSCGLVAAAPRLPLVELTCGEETYQGKAVAHDDRKISLIQRDGQLRELEA